MLCAGRSTAAVFCDSAFRSGRRTASELLRGLLDAQRFRIGLIMALDENMTRERCAYSAEIDCGKPDQMPLTPVKISLRTRNEAQGRELRPVSIPRSGKRHNAYTPHRPGNADGRHGLTIKLVRARAARRNGPADRWYESTNDSQNLRARVGPQEKRLTAKEGEEEEEEEIT